MVTNSKKHRSSRPKLSIRLHQAQAANEEALLRADEMMLDDLDAMLDAGVDELRLSVCNFSVNGKAGGDCGLVLLKDGVGVGLSPEMLLMLLNHPRFHRRPAPVVLMADLRPDPNITFDMMAADGPEPSFELLIDPSAGDSLL